MEDIIITSANEMPVEFTGKAHLMNYGHLLGTYYYINGRMIMYKAPNGMVAYFPDHTGVSPSTFERMYESLSSQEKEVVIWNLDLWK